MMIPALLFGLVLSLLSFQSLFAVNGGVRGRGRRNGGLDTGHAS